MGSDGNLFLRKRSMFKVTQFQVTEKEHGNRNWVTAKTWAQIDEASAIEASNSGHYD